MASLKTITHAELDALCKNGTPIDSKGGYPAVVLHPNGDVTKFWARKKSIFSSSRVMPYSTRFIRNAQRLSSLEIVVPEILSHAKLEKSSVRLVTYRGLTGMSIRELLRDSPADVSLPDLCSYIHLLQNKGILFGGMHLGNIIQMDSGYGLIDFTDVRYYKNPLSLKSRAANLKTPLRYAKDIANIDRAGLPDLIETYIGMSSFTSSEKEKFKSLVQA